MSDIPLLHASGRVSRGGTRKVMIEPALPNRERPSLVSEGSSHEGVVDNYPVSKAVSVAKKRRNSWWDKQTGPVADGRWPQLAPIRANINANRAAKAFT